VTRWSRHCGRPLKPRVMQWGICSDSVWRSLDLLRPWSGWIDRINAELPSHIRALQIQYIHKICRFPQGGWVNVKWKVPQIPDLLSMWPHSLVMSMYKYSTVHEYSQYYIPFHRFIIQTIC
jgi:hypothetical protein